MFARRSIALVQSAAALPPYHLWQRRCELTPPALSAASGPALTPDLASSPTPPPRRNDPAGAGTRQGRVARRLSAFRGSTLAGTVARASQPPPAGAPLDRRCRAQRASLDRAEHGRAGVAPAEPDWLVHRRSIRRL